MHQGAPRARLPSPVPVYALTDELSFPHPSLATADGLLAVGGDLSPERLVTAYASGIFPWYTDDDPEILWWAPSPRLVLLPEALHVGRSLRKVQRRAPYRLSLDEAFPQVDARPVEEIDVLPAALDSIEPLRV